MAANSRHRRKSMPPSRRKQMPRQQPRQQRARKIESSPEQQSQPSVSLFIHLVRLVICGLGASTIAGTAISISNPPKQQIAAKVEPPLLSPKSLQIDSLTLTRSSLELKRQLQAAIGSSKAKNSSLDPSYLFVEIDSGEYSEFGADRVLPAASTIKLPILIALFQDVDAQKVQLTEKLKIAGSQRSSILTAVNQMMTVNDNTATNLLIDRLGGAAALNQRFRDWGLAVTSIHRPLPDLDGTNVTTTRELARAMMAIARGKIVSASSRSQILSMMSNTILPKDLRSGAKIDRQTGNVNLIELPTGKKYIAIILMNHPQRNSNAPELVQQLSTIAYNYLQQPSPSSRKSDR
ncbi:serine hydrolase [Chamaesiphon sp. VAR_48_metabat_135_sub]|uniref:serine hydrolase n=1 Tax=Chamaesiphon sp. VAR_48_metabat_135_sub TaxID=2964699 RepID=UPI00286B858E|nr:serine hydrolase [Chamaesiphon sp. VAR_48_metabat_135_sub]